MHNYHDVIRYQVKGNNDAAELKTFLREIYCLRGNNCIPGRTDWASGNLWVGATGAYRSLLCREHPSACPSGGTVRPFTEQEQCRAAAFINRFANLHERITRIYFYTFIDPGGDDTGIVDRDGRRARMAYYTVRDRAQRCRG